jgi:hypothetical protein
MFTMPKSCILSTLKIQFEWAFISTVLTITFSTYILL